MVDRAIEDVRRIVSNLHPTILDDLGIIATISWFMREFRKVYSGIQTQVEVGIEEEEIPELIKIVIYRVIQEAFHNVAKHSNATFVGLSLIGDGDAVELMIWDDGVGFDASERRYRKGLGITSMKERVETSGGAFSIESSVGKGTIVRAIWSE
jgi:signal transduction histidine kinase